MRKDIKKTVERGEEREREKSKNREKGGKSFRIMSIHQDQRQRIERRENRTRRKATASNMP